MSDADSTPSLVLFHGAQRWSGPPSHHEAPAKALEHGAGFYLTTSVDTARKYARGGGRVMEFRLDPDIRWSNDVEVSLPAMKGFVEQTPRLRFKKEILADLDRNASRVGRPGVLAFVLVNLLVNYRSIAGKVGPLLTAFLVEHGVDAELVPKSGDEDWVVLYNLEKILSWKLAVADAEDVPSVRAQIRALSK